MNKSPLEKEVKFYLSDLSSYENRLRSLGAVLLQPRTRELNYRFDTKDLNLSRSQQVLRLRQDQKNILT
jgi:adenylate cyclase class IV